MVADWWGLAAVAGYGIGGGVAVYAAVWHWRVEARHSAAAWGLVAAMCVLYVIAWAFVAFDADLNRAAWSATITPSSTIFPLVFTLPAVIPKLRIG